MTKELWRQYWFDTINGLTLSEFQENNQVNMADSGVYRSFDDFVNIYVDKVLCGYDYQFYIEENWLTQAEYEIIKDWHNEIENYILSINDDSNDTTIISDNKCLSILHNGMLVKQKLMLIISESEKEYLK